MDLSLLLYHSLTTIVYLLLYVNDMVITGNNPSLVQSLITRLSQEFSMKDLGTTHYFLGFEVFSNDQGMFLNQTKYELNLLQCVDLVDAKSISTLFVVGHHLSTEGKLISIQLFFTHLSVIFNI